MRWMAVEGRGFPVSGSTFMIEGTCCVFSFLFFFSSKQDFSQLHRLYVYQI